MLTVIDRSGNGMGVGFVKRSKVEGQLTANGVGLSTLVQGEFNVSLTGTFVADVQVVRSYDMGVNWQPLTASGYAITLSNPAEEIFQEDEPGVLYAVKVTNYASGTVKYRISQ